MVGTLYFNSEENAFFLFLVNDSLISGYQDSVTLLRAASAPLGLEVDLDLL